MQRRLVRANEHGRYHYNEPRPLAAGAFLKSGSRRIAECRGRNVMSVTFSLAPGIARHRYNVVRGDPQYTGKK